MAGWGLTEQTSGASSYVLASWLFLRLMGLIYLTAFWSLATQIEGLLGTQGILPVTEFLESRRRGALRFLRLPTLCWWNSSNAFLLSLSWGGVMLSLALVAGFAPFVI